MKPIRLIRLGVFIISLFIVETYALADIWESPSFKDYQKGVTLYNQAKLEESRRALLKAVKECPNNLPAVYLLAEVSMALRDYDEALDYYMRAAELYPAFTEIQAKIAYIYHLKGDLAKARSFYEKVLTQEPENILILKNLAQVVIAQNKDDQLAVECLEKVLKLNSEDVETIQVLADLLERKKKIKRLKELLRKGYEVTSHPDLGLRLAYLLFSQGDLGEAKAVFQEVAGLRPRDADLFYALGIIEHRQGNDDASIGHLQKALELRPDFFEAAYNLGILYLTRKEATKAVTYFKKCVSIRPDAKEPYERLAQIYQHLLLDIQQARIYSEKAKALER